MNIGLQTAVEFLEKKSELGEVKPEPSFKLNDAQYGALMREFQQDKEVRSQAEKLLQKKPKDKKRDTERKDHGADKLLASSRHQQYKPLGKIDLDSIGKKPAEKEPVAQDRKEEPENLATAVSQEQGKADEAKAPTQHDKKPENPAQETMTVRKEEKTVVEDVRPEPVEIAKEPVEDTGEARPGGTAGCQEWPELVYDKERKENTEYPKGERAGQDRP